MNESSFRPCHCLVMMQNNPTAHHELPASGWSDITLWVTWQATWNTVSVGRASNLKCICSESELDQINLKIRFNDLFFFNHSDYMKANIVPNWFQCGFAQNRIWVGSLKTHKEHYTSVPVYCLSPLCLLSVVTPLCTSWIFQQRSDIIRNSFDIKFSSWVNTMAGR